jgi:hypothetical protein
LREITSVPSAKPYFNQPWTFPEFTRQVPESECVRVFSAALRAAATANPVDPLHGHSGSVIECVVADWLTAGR